MRSFIILFALIICVGTTAAQKRSVDPRLSKTQPSLYITFERVGKIASSSAGEMQETVWLRLHNNTRWPIILDMNDVPSKAYGDAHLFHDVLAEGKVIAEERCHACSSNLLLPGHYLVFTVPRADLAQGYSIRVRFNYGWEDGNDVAGRREVEHSVYFHSADLKSLADNARLSSAGDSHMTADLEHLNQIWAKAWLDKDAALVEKLMADDYVYIAPNGHVMDRQAILNVIRSPGYHLNSGTRTEVIIKPVGEDSAVVVHHAQSEGSFEGKTFKEDHRCTMLCARRAGEWRVVLEQCSLNNP